MIAAPTSSFVPETCSGTLFAEERTSVNDAGSVRDCREDHGEVRGWCAIRGVPGVGPDEDDDASDAKQQATRLRGRYALALRDEAREDHRDSGMVEMSTAAILLSMRIWAHASSVLGMTLSSIVSAAPLAIKGRSRHG